MSPTFLLFANLSTSNLSSLQSQMLAGVCSWLRKVGSSGIRVRMEAKRGETTTKAKRGETIIRVN